MSISQEVREKLVRYQHDELTGHHIYKRLAQTIKSPENRRIVEQIAVDELEHYLQWKSYTQKEIKPDRMKIWLYYLS
jgi:rubrerythrin